MHLLSLVVFLVCSSLYLIECKPVSEVLPHSRDYYAGYIKAITDNFDQLFTKERKARSTSDSDEDDTTTTQQDVDPLLETDDETLKEVKRDAPEETKKVNEPKKSDKTQKRSDKVAAESSTKVAATEDDDDDDKKDADKKSNTTEKESEAEEEESPEETSEQEEEDSDKKSNVEENKEEEDEDENPSENDENEEEEEDEDAVKKGFVLEHAKQGVPVLPSILSGYQEDGQPEVANQNEINSQYAMPYAARPNYGSFMNNMPLGAGPMTGSIRSKIKTKSAGKKSDCGEGDPHHLQRVLMLPNCCDDCCGGCCNHHTTHHGCGCGCTTHHCGGCGGCGGCGHHGGCGCHELVHDIHHAPHGHCEYYSHDSPCLTYPHLNHVTYGYGNGGHGSCGCGGCGGGCEYISGHGCGCGHPYQSHHPVILHPTYQECHHHNVHVAGCGCNHGCGCHHGCCNNGCCNDCCHTTNVVHHHPCNVHRHVNHVHHVYDNGCHCGCNSCGHHGGCGYGGYTGGNCRCDPDIAVMPHYGHTTAGHSGWNPYWGH